MPVLKGIKETLVGVDRELRLLSGGAFFTMIVVTAVPLLVALDFTADEAGWGTIGKVLLAVSLATAAALSRNIGRRRDERGNRGAAHPS
jgi:hypothetical protein